jgi:hypothetical protein
LPIDAACTDDEDCCQNGGVQERCVLGHCQTRGQSGALCGKDFDCAGTLSCQNGTCGPRSGLGGPCDSDNDCVFDATSNTQPVCSGGTCGLPNGTPTTGPASCVSGQAVDCDYGKICGECCATSVTGFDPVFCGDLESEKICCNHTCIYRNHDNHCGQCNLDCTCGGTDPYRFCSTKYDSEAPSWDWRAFCDGNYSGESGHCDDRHGDYCATSGCEGCSLTCDCANTSPTTPFCLACCQGQDENLVLETCLPDGHECLPGDDANCCEELTCEQQFNCPHGASICLSYTYACAAS